MLALDPIIYLRVVLSFSLGTAIVERNPVGCRGHHADPLCSAVRRLGLYARGSQGTLRSGTDKNRRLIESSQIHFPYKLLFIKHIF